MLTPIAIIMGSDSDWPLVKKTADTLAKFDIACDVHVMSAHRTPEHVRRYVQETAVRQGVKVFIGAAGVAAHLPGVLASLTTLPIIGIPVKSGALDGMDALLSIAQMPPGIPVATMAIDGAVNAALFALQILAVSDNELAQRMRDYRLEMAKNIEAKDKALQDSIRCKL